MDGVDVWMDGGRKLVMMMCVCDVWRAKRKWEHQSLDGTHHILQLLLILVVNCVRKVEVGGDKSPPKGIPPPSPLSVTPSIITKVTRKNEREK